MSNRLPDSDRKARKRADFGGPRTATAPRLAALQSRNASGAAGSALAPHTRKVAGSNPAAPIIRKLRHDRFSRWLARRAAAEESLQGPRCLNGRPEMPLLGLVGEAHQPPNECFVDPVTLHDLRIDVKRQARVGSGGPICP